MMLYDIPTAILVIVLLLLSFATVEAGIRVGNRYGQRTWSNAHDIHTALTGATLALMGLMLAFTFNMSATRFDARKTLIVTEANAIQTVRSNLDYLAPSPRTAALKQLHSYLDQRIAFLDVGHNPARERQAILSAQAGQSTLWRIATNSNNYAAADAQLRAAEFSQLTQSLLDLNNVARQREAARARRVPGPVLLLLFALALGSGALLAYISGASGHPDRLPTYMLLCLICLVIYLIIDFDRPRRGLMRLDATPLGELQQQPWV